MVKEPVLYQIKRNHISALMMRDEGVQYVSTLPAWSYGSMEDAYTLLQTKDEEIIIEITLSHLKSVWNNLEKDYLFGPLIGAHKSKVSSKSYLQNKCGCRNLLQLAS